MSEDTPAPKRVRLSNEDISLLSKEELISKLLELETYNEELEKKQTDLFCAGDSVALEEKWKQQQLENSRKEKVLVMKLTAKEQELQELAADLSKAQTPSTSQLRNSLLDPSINLLFQKMRKETEDSKTKLQQANDDMAAWKFTPDSQTGKRLMSKCRSLLLENQELGKQISSGKTAQLEAELALQKTYSEELKTSQDELNEFVIELDEEVEGMQSTICTLQQQLKECKEELANCKSQSQTSVNSNEPLLKTTEQQETVASAHAERYNVPVRTESGPFSVGIHPSKLSVELEEAKLQDEGYRTTHAAESSAAGNDVTDEKTSVNINKLGHHGKHHSDFVEEEQFLDDDQEVEVKYGWEDEKGETLRKNKQVDVLTNQSKTVKQDNQSIESIRTDSVSDVRIDDDNDTGNETPSYGELSDNEQNDSKLSGSNQLLGCKLESTYKPNNILTVDPIQKSLPIESDEDDNPKGNRTDSPVNGRALEQHSVALPLDSTKISLVDGYSSDDGGGSVELSTAKANTEHNGLHKLSDGIDDECMETN